MRNLKVKKSERELIFNKINGKWHFLDQLSESEIWIKISDSNNYLTEKYGITSEQYFSLIKYNDIHYAHKCPDPRCSNLLNFINIKVGYSKTCGCRDCNWYVRSERAKLQHADPNSLLNASLRKLHKDENYRKGRSEHMRSLNNKNWMDLEYVSRMRDKSYETINSWTSKCKNKYKAFLRQGSLDDECIFYVGLTDSNDIKFGVTGVNLDKGRCNRKWRLKLKSIHRLRISDRKTIAEIEMNLKFQLGSDSEYVEFSKLREIINFVRDYK